MSSDLVSVAPPKDVALKPLTSGVELPDLAKESLSTKTKDSLVSWAFSALGKCMKGVCRAIGTGIMAAVDIAGPSLVNLFADDKFVSAAATGGYKFLPPLLKKVIPMPVFVAFCVSRKHDIGQLVGGVVDRAKARKGEQSPPQLATT